MAEGNARQAGRLESELEASKAKLIEEIEELETIHGEAGGAFDGAKRFVGALGNTSSAAVERIVNTVRSKGEDSNFDARVVEVDPESFRGKIQRALVAIGLDVVFFEANTSDFVVSGAHDTYGAGRRILLNIAVGDAAHLKTIASHEIVHALRQASPTAWARFFSRMNVMDPDGLRKAGLDYFVGLNVGKTQDFESWFASPDGRSESAARYIEERSADTGFFDRVVGTDRNLAAVFRDIIQRILSALEVTGLDTQILVVSQKLADAAHKSFKKAPAISSEQQEAIVEQVNLAIGKRPRGKKGETLRQVEAVTGIKKDTMSDQDMKNLRKVLRQQKKASDIGFKGGVTNAQSKVLSVLEGVFGKMGLDVTERMIVRMQKARAARSPQQVAREGIRLMEGKVSLIRHQLREDIRAKRVSVASIKRQVQEAVTDSLKGPIGVKMQGRFLGDVRRAESPAALLRALRRVDRAVGQVKHREAVSDLKKVQRKLKKFKPMTNEIRTNSALELTKARPHAVTDQGRIQTFKTRQEYDDADFMWTDACNLWNRADQRFFSFLRDPQRKGIDWIYA